MFTRKIETILTASILIACYIFTIVPGDVESATIVGSKHDFSALNTLTTPFAGVWEIPGPGGFPIVIDEICVFCHTPHGATKGVPGLANAPLWNRTNTSSAYTYLPYTSATLSVSPSVTPTGTSMMCMSCHDGVSSIAVGTLINGPGHGNPTVTPNGIAAPGAIGSIYQGTPFTGWGPNLGENYPGMAGNTFINLSNDHPISFDWPVGGLAGQIYSTPQNTRLRLFGAGSRMECATCHQVHDPANVPFLSMSNSGSAMCVACHIK